MMCSKYSTLGSLYIVLSRAFRLYYYCCFFNKIANKKDVLAKITKVTDFIDNIWRNIGNICFESIAITSKIQPTIANNLDKFVMFNTPFHFKSL